MRGFLAFFLAALIALTSQALGGARGQAVASGQMVICSGGQIVTVTVDADGNPVGPAHICPDCALKVLVLSPVVPGPAFVTAAAPLPRALGAVLSQTSAATLAPNARAPPLRS